MHEKYFNLNGELRRFKAISVYFSRHTKMVGGDYSQEEKAHTELHDSIQHHTIVDLFVPLSKLHAWAGLLFWSSIRSREEI